MYKKICIIIFFASIFLSGFCAFSCAEEFLTLARAIATAYDNNPYMIEARKMISGAKGELTTARALLNPEIEFELAGLRKDEEGNQSARLGSFTVIQGFEPLGTYGLKTRIARNEVSIRGESLKSVWSAIYSEVRKSYAKIILDKKRLELASANLDVYRRFYGRVDLRFQSGKALKNELQRSKIELLRSENDYIIAQKNLKADSARLNLLLGRDMEISFVVEEDLKEEGLDINFEEVKNIALTRSPDIRIEELRLDSGIRNLNKEQLSRLPSPYVGFKNVNETYDLDYNILIGASVPLWDLNQGRVEKARADKEARETMVGAVKREVAFEVYQAYLDVDLNKKQLGLLKSSLSEANELLRLADLHYSEGEIDFINFLDQVKASTETRMRYYEGLFELSASIDRLEKAIYASLRKEEYLK